MEQKHFHDGLKQQSDHLTAETIQQERNFNRQGFLDTGPAQSEVVIYLLHLILYGR